MAIARGSELQVAAIDPVTRVIAGAPQTVIPAVATSDGQAQFAVSARGSLLYVPPGATPASARLELGAPG